MTLLEALQQTMQSYRNAAIFALQKDDPTVACLWVRIMNKTLPPEYRVTLKELPIEKGRTQDRWKVEMWGWFADTLEAVEDKGATYIQEKLASYSH